MAQPGTTAGHLWLVVVAVDFFLLSNPLALLPAFELSLDHAVRVTLVMVVLYLPWLRAPRIPWTVALLLAWAALSIFWSISPTTTQSSLRLYVTVALLAVVIAANAAPGVIAEGMAWGGAAVFVVSFLALRAEVPGVAAPPGGEGYLAGIGTNRNILAYTLVLSFAFLLAVRPRGVAGTVKWSVLAAVHVVGIYLASSATGYLSTIAVVVAAAAVRWAPGLWRGVGVPARRWIVLVAVVGAAAAVAGYDRISTVLQRDGATLSGRVPFWEATIEVTHDHALTGYGWGAIWAQAWGPAPDNPVVQEIYARSGIVLSHGHNSLFDVLPAVGYVGVLLVCAVFAHALQRAWRVSRADPSEGGRTFVRCAVVVLAGHVVFGLTEPMATIPLGWFCLVLLVAMGMERPGRQPRSERGAPG